MEERFLIRLVHKIPEQPDSNPGLHFAPYPWVPSKPKYYSPPGEMQQRCWCSHALTPPLTALGCQPCPLDASFYSSGARFSLYSSALLSSLFTVCHPPLPTYVRWCEVVQLETDTFGYEEIHFSHFAARVWHIYQQQASLVAGWQSGMNTGGFNIHVLPR